MTAYAPTHDRGLLGMPGGVRWQVKGAPSLQLVRELSAPDKQLLTLREFQGIFGGDSNRWKRGKRFAGQARSRPNRLRTANEPSTQVF